MPTQFSTSLISSSDGGGAAIFQLGILLLIPFAMYFFMIRPQRRRAREQRELQGAIQIGDQIVTTSGLFGRITGEDGDSRFWLEIDDDVQVRIARAAVQGRVLDDDQDSERDEDDVDDAANDLDGAADDALEVADGGDDDD